MKRSHMRSSVEAAIIPKAGRSPEVTCIAAFESITRGLLVMGDLACVSACVAGIVGS